jgi:hypothetical protein
LRDLPGGERGLLLFEQACPIHTAAQHPPPLAKGEI